MILGINLYLINSLVGMNFILDHNYVGTLRIQVIVTITRIVSSIILFPFIGFWVIVLNVYALVLVFWFGELGLQKSLLVKYQLSVVPSFVALVFVWQYIVGKSYILEPGDSIFLFVGFFINLYRSFASFFA